ncbi:homocysteine S-methyltransferase [Halopseudomonas laoshanensis]|uniref:Homocysteine S-methyltransferase n=1 Tax=Halopseudomonas laoshanensis TaxID=2268758 RepID=A0A7V7GPJ0_9GAMM|nr:homocysteine S-methyltransferase family protein [Halopseudomonas laoshanensis]KAA0691359.1 homocysteine S-methyltransferase [Halopseudomonas laoshanensis]
MTKYRSKLPQMHDQLFLTDGGLETTLIFQDGVDLPHFASFTLLKDKDGRDRLRRYYQRYAEIARAGQTGFILEAPTWRASADWGAKLGYSKQALVKANADAIFLLEEVRATCQSADMPVVISGCIGPRGDGYNPAEIMGEEEAQAFHSLQVNTFANSEADMITAMTITNLPEAIGITRAAQAARMPLCLSFTVETDGRLPTGETLRTAIETVDNATGHGPVYYMINCAHPSHFTQAVAGGESWLQRIRGIRANASKCSHAQLDNATELDAGDPIELGREYAQLRELLPWLTVLGGCCGTDHRHIEQICEHCVTEA